MRQFCFKLAILVVYAQLSPCLRVSASLRPSSQPADTKRYWKKDPIALRQEVDAFTTLQDGHPAAPGDWELQFDAGWLTRRRRSDSAPLTPTVKYTPHRYTTSGYEFFEAMQLSLSMPLEMHDGNYSGSGDMSFGWQERWIAEHDGIPTFSTLAEVRMPTGRESNGADSTLTAILDKDLGPGTGYLNGWVRSNNGDSQTPETASLGTAFARDTRRWESLGIKDERTEDDRRPFQWGLRIGYKLPLGERTSLIADYVHQASEQAHTANLNFLELALLFRTKHHLAFGPGLMVGLDNHPETPRFAAGLRVLYLFNARNPPTE